MAADPRQLHVILFPFSAYGHMIPTADIARLFAARGAKTTIITTPLNAPTFLKSIQTNPNLNGPPIELEIFHFPGKEVGLPDGVENLDQISGEDDFGKFIAASEMLRHPLEQLLADSRPDCLVADMFFPWATDAAAKFNIPRLVFHGSGYFNLCASEVLRLYQPQRNIANDDEPFSLPSLPHEIKMTKQQLSDEDRENVPSEWTEFDNQMKESEVKSYGVIVNSFYELESAYADFYRQVLGRRSWSVGPVSLCNRNATELDKAPQRGRELAAAIDKHKCLKWLDSKKPDSVIYISFGSTIKFTAAQLLEIAMALEASDQQFIWVLRGSSDHGTNDHEWLPEGFEQRMEENGLIIREWAPQVQILEHEAVGGFVTHCGWNSILEGVCAGVPMVTWPIFADQFYNEKLLTEILKIGVPVGANQWANFLSVSASVKRDAIEKAVREIMAGEEEEERRNRAEKLKEMARKAVGEDGSSYSDLSSLVEELGSYNLLNGR